MKNRDELRNFNGTLMFKDVPLVEIVISNGELHKFNMIENNRRFLPLLMYDFCSPYTLQLFIAARIVPRTRQNLQRVLDDLGLTEYSWDGIIKANYGLCTDDCCWFKPKGSTLTYDDIKIRD